MWNHCRDWSAQVQDIAAKNRHDAVPIENPIFKTVTDTDSSTKEELFLNAVQNTSMPKQKL